MTQYFAYRNFSLPRAPLHTRVLISSFSVVILVALAVGVVNFWDKTGMTPAGIVSWYRGNEGVELPAGRPMAFEKSFRELLDATHPHLFGQAVLLFILSHIVALTGLTERTKIAIYTGSFGAMLFDAATPWLIRYVSPALAPLQIVSVFALTASFLAQLWFPFREMWFSRPAVEPARGESRPGAPPEAKSRRGGPSKTALLVAMIGLALASPGAAKPEEQRYSRAWLLMGTIFEVTLYAPDSAAAVSAFDAAYAAASEVDSLMSLYRPESELCRVNREAARGPVSVSGPTFEVVAASLKFSRETQGAFDPTVKPAMDAWGFYRRALHAPAPAELDSLRGLIGAEKIRLRPADRSIEFARAGMSLDLGGIAKGYAADRSAAALKRRGVTRALVDLGGNMLAMSSPPDEKGWPVGVRDPVRTDSLLAVIELADRAIASSGDYEKFVVLDGVRYGHLLDPKVAAPVRGMAGTTVVAGDAMTADALSTAAFVLGEAMCGEVLAGRPGVDYVCVSIDETLSLARYAGSGLFKNFLPTGTVATGLDGP